MKRCFIFCNTEKKIAGEFYLELIEYLKKKKNEIIIVDNMEFADFIIIIGGDGTFLRASKQIINNPKIDILAINAGSLGFLTGIKIEEAFIHIENYLKGEYILKVRKMLEVNVREKKYYALNEA
ncbi:MAG: NAD(+)/NADH kinase, partial [Fusobacteriaceae bacterium]